MTCGSLPLLFLEKSPAFPKGSRVRWHNYTEGRGGDNKRQGGPQAVEFLPLLDSPNNVS